MNRQQRRQELHSADMLYQNGLFGPEKTPFLLVRPENAPKTRPVVVPFTPAPGISDDFEGRGLHLVTLGADLRGRGVGLRVLEKGIDTTTAEGRAMFGMLSVLAELQKRTHHR